MKKGTREAMRRRITEAIAAAKSASQSPDPSGYLPVIIETLEDMLKGLDLDLEHRKEIVAGLGKIITDDYAFASSPLAIRIGKLAGDFASVVG